MRVSKKEIMEAVLKRERYITTKVYINYNDILYVGKPKMSKEDIKIWQETQRASDGCELDVWRKRCELVQDDCIDLDMQGLRELERIM